MSGDIYEPYGFMGALIGSPILLLGGIAAGWLEPVSHPPIKEVVVVHEAGDKTRMQCIGKNTLRITTADHTIKLTVPDCSSNLRQNTRLP